MHLARCARTAALSSVAAAVLLAFACAEYDASLLHYAIVDAATEQQDGPGLPDADSAVPEVGEELDAQADAAEQGPDAVADAAEDFDPRDCDPCKDPSLERPPCARPGPDPVSGEQRVYAMRTFRFGGSQSSDLNEWKQIGYDLDCMLTSAGGLPVPCVPSELLIAEDGESGRDNSFGRNAAGGLRMLGAQGLLVDLEEASNQRMAAGLYGTVVVLDGYGGTDDDPVVSVAVHPSVGVRGANGLPAAPKWDGEDRWALDATSMQGGNTPLYVDHNAYVSGGIVVARLQLVPVAFESVNTRTVLPVHSAVLTLQLSGDRKSVLRAVLSGVVPEVEARTALDELAAQAGLCPGLNQTYDEARVVMQKLADVRADLQVAETQACDAVSAAFEWTGQTAKAGEVVKPEAHVVPKCPEDGGS